MMNRQDEVAQGFIGENLDPLRYDVPWSDDPSEAAGLILSMMPDKARVLDVGCGTGSLAVFIRDRRQVEIIGIEPDTARADHAKSKGLQVYNEYMGKDLIARLGVFDVILFADVLEHLPDPTSLLRIAKLGLSPGGCVIASIPNVAHWSVRWDLLRGQFRYQKWGIMDATHLRWFTADSIKYLFATEKFKIKDQKVSAGVDLDAYREQWPWRNMNMERRRQMVRFASKRWPSLFGCQYIVKAIPE